MEQTAVEWFYDKIKSHFKHDGDLFETLIFTMEIAKEKEKQQIIKAYETAMETDSYNTPLKVGKQYYNETFKK